MLLASLKNCYGTVLPLASLRSDFISKIQQRVRVPCDECGQLYMSTNQLRKADRTVPPTPLPLCRDLMMRVTIWTCFLFYFKNIFPF